MAFNSVFPSAISRYLVSDYAWTMNLDLCRKRFHPLYRGTWYLTTILGAFLLAFMGMFPSAISRYLVSDLQPGCG